MVVHGILIWKGATLPLKCRSNLNQKSRTRIGAARLKNQTTKVSIKRPMIFAKPILLVWSQLIFKFFVFVRFKFKILLKQMEMFSTESCSVWPTWRQLEVCKSHISDGTLAIGITQLDAAALDNHVNIFSHHCRSHLLVVIPIFWTRHLKLVSLVKRKNRGIFADSRPPFFRENSV